jgi:hypothetical protein
MLLTPAWAVWGGSAEKGEGGEGSGAGGRDDSVAEKAAAASSEVRGWLLKGREEKPSREGRGSGIDAVDAAEPSSPVRELLDEGADEYIMLEMLTRGREASGHDELAYSLQDDSLT